jgi:UDP:flavonoid glycosyltransferase YjiC (YdhE family)
VRAAVITWDGGGNREPFEALCLALRGRGTDIQVLSHESQRALYQSSRASFDALPIGARVPGVRASEKDDISRAVTTWTSEDNARAVHQTLSAVRCDIAIVDVCLVAAFASCEAAGTPFVALHHTLPGSMFGGSRRERFEQLLVGPVNEVRLSLGLPPLAGLGQMLASARAHIVPTASVLDSPIPWDLPLHYVGPMKKEDAGTQALPDLPARFVLVSFSTTWQRQVEPLQATIDALAQLDRSIVVTTGPAIDPKELIAASNTVILSELPHGRILDRVDAVVTHAGHGTVLSALSAGVPLVCMPMGRDQHEVTARVVAVGAGLKVDVNRVNPDLRPAVEQVLQDPSFAQGATAMARAIANHGGVDEALSIIDRSTGASAP